MKIFSSLMRYVIPGLKVIPAQAGINSLLGRPRPKLAVAWKQDSVSLYLFERPGGLDESVLLDQRLDSGLASKIKEFVGNPLPQTILVIPRSEVLQKEMVLGMGLGEGLETELARALPYSPKEMAYSLAVDSPVDGTYSRGLLYAIPEQKIKEILGSMANLGIEADEAVSEDQVLFWLFQGQTAGGSVLVLDETPERTLFLVLKENAILFSRVYPREEELKNVLSEISFALLEAGVKPVKAFVSATVESREVAKALEIPVESFDLDRVRGEAVPAALSGAKRWEANTAISLLPGDRKLAKRGRMQKQLLKEGLAAFGLFLTCLSLLFASQMIFMKHKAALLEKKMTKLASAVSETREMSVSLAKISEAERSKLRLLSFLRELASRAPALVRLKELRIEDRRIVFQGESPSHALLTETVQVFEKMEGVGEVKLEHARLRKRLNQEFLDFEVTARWQS